VLHFPSVCHPKFFPRDKYEFGSYIQNAENVVLSALRFEAFLDANMPVPNADYKKSPLLAPSLAGLPPTRERSRSLFSFPRHNPSFVFISIAHQKLYFS
jgi:hypothetical protein